MSRARWIDRAQGLLLNAAWKRTGGESVEVFDPGSLVEELRPVITDIIEAAGDPEAVASTLLYLYRRYAGSGCDTVSMIFRANRSTGSNTLYVASEKAKTLRRVRTAQLRFTKPRNVHLPRRNAPILAMATLLVVACGDAGTVPEPPPRPNRTPVVSGSIPPQTAPVGESVTVSVASSFSDPDGDDLTYTATSSASGVASVAVSGVNVTVTGVSAGTATITVTASDPGGLSAQQAFPVTVPNRAPVVTDSISDQTVHTRDSVSLDLPEHFSDPDGDILAFTAEVSDTAVAGVVVTETKLAIGGISRGTTIVTVTASDPGGLEAEQAFGVEVTVPVPLSDRDILELLYEETDGPSWSAQDGWMTEGPLNRWWGVSADGNDRVTRLELISNNLTGQIPRELGQLSNLEGLSLSHNALTGPIPKELGELSNLESLNLDTNGLTGPIPPALGQLSSLRSLDVWNNTLTGPIPSELGQLSNLARLSLSHNTLTGPIPVELSQLFNLRSLFLTRNDLTGPIPPSLGQLSNLEGLGLGSNNLTGPIPLELVELTNLEALSLGSNNLTGRIPPQLGELSRLVSLQLGSNNLTGPIPRELGELADLARLRLEYNALTGPIPRELGKLANLEWLTLGSNPLTGAIPPELGGLSRLTLLAISHTKLTGQIPPELGHLSKLWGLDLQRNDLTGPVPPELGQLFHLQLLLLGGNDLTDPIPDSFLALATLEVLYIQDNNGLCVPSTTAFEDWVGRLADFRGGYCASGY